MYGMRWSWRDLEETPVYVRKYCFDLLNIRRKCIAQRKAPGGS